MMAAIRSKRRRTMRGLLSTIAAITVAACSTAPPRHPHGETTTQAPPPAFDINTIADAVPRAEPLAKRGNPPYYDALGKRYYTRTSSSGFVQRGVASWYGPTFHGKDTSTGEPYDMYAMTAAHKTLPLPTYVRVTNLSNNRSIVVRVNDRGPFVDDRIIDLSYTAAAKLDMLGPGTAPVEIRAIDPNPPQQATNVVAAKAAPGMERAAFVQVGAFRNRATAEQTRERVRRVADSAHINADNGSKGSDPWYRVRIGPLANATDIDRIIGTLSQMGFKPFTVLAE